jgi:hypothetical protein
MAVVVQVQQHERPIERRELPDGGQQGPQALGGRRVEPGRADVVHQGIERHREGLPRRVTAQPRDGHVQGHAVHPRGERPRRVVRRVGPPELRQDVLDEIVAVGVGPAVGARHLVEHAPVGLDRRHECLAPAVGGGHGCQPRSSLACLHGP